MEYEKGYGKKSYDAFVLWEYGWKRRKWKTNGKAFNQWRDPHSGLWYGKKVAMKILETQAFYQLNLK